MQNQNTKFETLLEYASLTLSQSAGELKERYKDYPVCLMDYIEKEIHEHMIEVRFDNEGATISASFDDNEVCDGSFLFLDINEDEELLIDHLVESAEYSFRKSCFELPSCLLKIKESKDNLIFYLYK